MSNGFRDFMNHDQWISASEETRQYEIYRMLCNLDFRMCVIERRPIFEKCLAFLGGILGGVAAMLGMKAL